MSQGAPETGGEAALLWTVEQVCRALACRRSWLYDQVEARRFPVVRLGRQLRFRPADITAYLNAQTQPAAAGALSPRPAGASRRRRRTTAPFSPRT
jgi:excisionase family DNA binding protein